MENFQAEGRTQYRLFEYDFIRVVAMVFVIAVHALVVIDFADKFSLFYFNVMQAVFFSCNGIFYDKREICPDFSTVVRSVLL